LPDGICEPDFAMRSNKEPAGKAFERSLLADGEVDYIGEIRCASDSVDTPGTFVG
jgi:hypothetical protein